jgi:hypothetical protein
MGAAREHSLSGVVAVVEEPGWTAFKIETPKIGAPFKASEVQGDG